MNVLLAVDYSPFSEAAVQAVIDRFRPDDTLVSVLHAVEWFREMPTCYQHGEGPDAARETEKCRERSFDRARRLVEEVATRLEFSGLRTLVATPDADPRQA